MSYIDYLVIKSSHKDRYFISTQSLIFLLIMKLLNKVNFHKLHVTMTTNKVLWVPARSMGKSTGAGFNVFKFVKGLITLKKPTKKLLDSPGSSHSSDSSSSDDSKSYLISKLPSLSPKGSKKNTYSSLKDNPIATPLSTLHVNKGKSKGKGKVEDQSILPDNEFINYENTFDTPNAPVETLFRPLSLPSPSYKHHNQIDSTHALTDVLDNTLPKLMMTKQDINTENVTVAINISIAENEFFTNISGLKSLDDGFRTRFKEDIVFRDKFTKFCLIEHAKFIYYICNIKSNDTTGDYLAYDRQVITGIQQCFNLVKNYEDISNDKDLKNFYMYHYPSFIQHMLNCFGHQYTIRPSDFKTIVNKPSAYFSLLNKIYMSNIIEYFITKQNYNLDNFSHNINFVDHKHPMFPQESDTDSQKVQSKVDRKLLHFSESKSVEQTGQKYSDLVLKKSTFDEKGHNIETIHRDVKTYYKNAYSGHVTLKPYLFSSITEARKYTNSYILLLSEKIHENPFVNRQLQDDLKNLSQIRSDIKDNNIKESILKFNQILVDMSISNIYIELGINITIASDIDIDDHFITNVLPYLEKKVDEHIKNDNDIFDIDIFFPKNNKISKLEYQKRMTKLIDTLIPEPLQKDVTTNYKKFIKDHDSK